MSSSIQTSSPPVDPSKLPQSLLSKRVQALISNDRLFDSVTPGSFEYLSGMINDNSVFTRKNLKSILESELVSIHGKFLGEYQSKVCENVGSSLSDVDRLEFMLTDAIDRLSINRERIESAIDKSVSIKNETEKIERKLVLLSRFSELFVTEKNSVETDTYDFESLVRRLDEIGRTRANCQELLKIIPNSSIAIESLNHSVEALDYVYERVYFAITKAHASITKEHLSRALFHLQDRPHHFHQCMMSLCKTHCDVLGGQFIQVLTKEQGGLEFNSFDSLKFLSGMLSWLLESARSEHEWLSCILDGIRESTWNESSSKGVYLDTCVSGVIELIEARFSNIIKSTFGPIDLFKLSKIISFYQSKMRPIAGSQTIEDLGSLKEIAWQSFMRQWEQRVQSERNSIMFQPSNHGLSPLPIISETVFMLDNILPVYSDAESDLNDDEIFSILSPSIDPLVQICAQTASQWGLSKTESATFILNCISTLQSPLKRFEFTKDYVSHLATLIEDQMEVLVSSTTEAILKKVGLLDKLIALRSAKASGADMTTIGDAHAISMTASFKAFYALLFSQGMSAATHTDMLVTRDLRTEARQGIGKSISAAYRELYEAVEDMGIATHSPDQVQALLDIY
jgi:hypothetical protein